jgi:transcriptional regulator with XRE-family HTH domain
MNHPFDVQVGSNLRHCRVWSRMTQQQLGDKLGITAQAIEDLECGARAFDLSVMRGILAVMDVPAAALLAGVAEALRASEAARAEWRRA